MVRWQDLKWIVVAGLVVASIRARADESPALPREVREIQRSLGGPAIDQFPSLRPADAQPMQSNADWAPQPNRTPPVGMWPNWSSDPATRVTPAMAVATDQRLRVQVGSLRETAAQLDGSANRLEMLELYQQADALRNVAQRLRMQARSMGDGAPPEWDAPADAPRRIERPASPGARGAEGRVERQRRQRARREGAAQPAPEPTPADPLPQNGG